MRERDVERVVSLEQQLFAGDPPWEAEQFRSELSAVPASRWYVVAEMSDEIVGYAGLTQTGETADVMTLAVAPARRRRGLGAMLLSALVVESRRRGARELLLDVRADNVAALALYERHGFERIGRRRGYYQLGRVDGLVLRLPLAEGECAAWPRTHR